MRFKLILPKLILKGGGTEEAGRGVALEESFERGRKRRSETSHRSIPLMIVLTCFGNKISPFICLFLG